MLKILLVCENPDIMDELIQSIGSNIRREYNPMCGCVISAFKLYQKDVHIWEYAHSCNHLTEFSAGYYSDVDLVVVIDPKYDDLNLLSEKLFKICGIIPICFCFNSYYKNFEVNSKQPFAIFSNLIELSDSIKKGIKVIKSKMLNA